MFIRISILILFLLLLGFGRHFIQPRGVESLLGLASVDAVIGFEKTNIDGIKFTIANVYSTYPFNHKSEVAIDADASDGIVVGQTVLAGESILLGRVVEVFDNYSVVQVLNDPNIKLPVRIGDSATDAILTGGAEAQLKMITSDAKIAVGDVIYSASKDFPYGLKVGKIKKLITSDADAFKEAIVELPYRLGDLREVLILIN